MGRPLYETDQDKSRQRRVAAAFAEAWVVQMIELRPLSPVDYAIARDGRVLGWAEVKCRTHKFGHYRTVILSSEKAMLGMARAEYSGLPFMLCVQFADSIAFVVMKDEYLKVMRMHGRADRCDVFDVEPCIEVPVSDMRVLRKTDGKWAVDRGVGCYAPAALQNGREEALCEG